MADNIVNFQTSKLTAQADSWTTLSDQMQPSNAPGSAPISKDDKNHDAQWMRKLSFVLYSQGSGDAASNTTRLTTPTPTPTRTPTPRDDIVNLPDVSVNAKASSGQSSDDKSKTSSGIDLSSLRCFFNIKQADASTPATLWARVYNMAPTTMAKVIQFTRIQVQAGYKYANFGLIFDGTVVQYKKGKENPTDTYFEIHAGDGDLRWNREIVITQYPAGTQDLVPLMNAAQKLGGGVGSVKYIDPEVGLDKSQRDTTEIASARDVVRQYMEKNDAKFFIEHGNIVILKNKNTRPGAPVILTTKTGLVSLPEVTPQGIECKCLLNPNIKLGGKIKLDTSVLSGVPFTPGSNVQVNASGDIQGDPTGGLLVPVATRKQMESAFTSPIGEYKVVLLEHQGDTRGVPWYSNIVGVALNDKGETIQNPASAASRGAPETYGPKAPTPTPTLSGQAWRQFGPPRSS